MSISARLNLLDLLVRNLFGGGSRRITTQVQDMRLAKFGCLGVKRWITRQIVSFESSNLPLEAAGVQGREIYYYFSIFPVCKLNVQQLITQKSSGFQKLRQKPQLSKFVGELGAKPCETAYQLCKP